MQVSHEHIEELMFDYFEGNLTEADKAILLDFIHLYPEYEKDFAQWAQSYTHIAEPVKDYGLAEGLVRKAPMFWSGKKLIMTGAAVSVLMAIVVFMTITKQKIISEHSYREAVTQMPQMPAPQNKVTYIKKEIVYSKKHASPVRKTVKKVNKLTNYGRQKERTVTTSAVTAPILQEQEAVSTSQGTHGIYLQSNQTSPTPDSLTNTAPASSTPAASPITKKSKKKVSLQLKPDADFMPVNDNF